MPDFIVGAERPSDRKDLPFDFSKIYLLGNAGRKINRFVYDEILSPYVTTHEEGQNAPGAGVKPQDLTKLRSKRGLLEVLLTNFNQVNPSSAELQPGQLPNGQYPTAEELAAREGKIPPPKVKPMWDADP